MFKNLLHASMFNNFTVRSEVNQAKKVSLGAGVHTKVLNVGAKNLKEYLQSTITNYEANIKHKTEAQHCIYNVPMAWPFSLYSLLVTDTGNLRKC